MVTVLLLIATRSNSFVVGPTLQNVVGVSLGAGCGQQVLAMVGGVEGLICAHCQASGVLSVLARGEAHPASLRLSKSDALAQQTGSHLARQVHTLCHIALLR